MTAMDRRSALKLLLGAGTAGLAGAGSYGFFIERHELSVTRASLPVAALPPSLAGLRIGLLTDIHRGKWVPHEDVARAVTSLMAEQPDMIVLGGDYVTAADRRYMGPAADALAPLSAPHGVFAVLGNHDDDRDMPAALEARGFDVLKDSRTRIVIKNEPIDLIGIRFWTRRAADIATLTRGSSGMPILLAHDPRRLWEAAALNLPLVLSGHTHGGQVVLPGIGAPAAQKFPVAAGIARRERTTLFVSRGLGTVYVPVRINCPPEAAVLTLERI
jgi:predicted MPP superfamily phosphohydrolase